MSSIKCLHISDEKYGNGAYGAVYKCMDDRGIIRAVKQVSVGKNGIPGLLEAAIMVTIQHPNIASAVRIFSSSGKLSIIQEPATMDLKKFIKIYGPPPQDKLKMWLFSLASAVACLHSEKLIHGDLKASNCLFFPDGTVKVTDFSLSVKVWTEDMLFHHPVCTGTHRPLENYQGMPWSYPLDIWSLGCTFYELATGRQFLPDQGVKDPKENWERSMRALLDWGVRHPFLNNGETISAGNFVPTNFELEEGDLRHLILSMLQIDPEARIKAREILAHPYFREISCLQQYRVNSVTSSLTTREQRKFTRIIHSTGMLLDKLIFDCAIEIYARANNEREIDEQLKVITCVWIASKLIWLRPIDLSKMYKPNEIFPAERAICEAIGYRLL